MYDPRPQFPSDRRQRAKMMQQGIDQRAAIPRIFSSTRAGMDHHSRRLVDHRQIVIFVDNIQRNLFCNRPKRSPRDLVQNFNLLAAAQLKRRLLLVPVHQDFVLRD